MWPAPEERGRGCAGRKPSLQQGSGVSSYQPDLDAYMHHHYPLFRHTLQLTTINLPAPHYRPHLPPPPPPPLTSHLLHQLSRHLHHYPFAIPCTHSFVAFHHSRPHLSSPPATSAILSLYLSLFSPLIRNSPHRLSTPRRILVARHSLSKGHRFIYWSSARLAHTTGAQLPLQVLLAKVSFDDSGCGD